MKNKAAEETIMYSKMTAIILAWQNSKAYLAK